MFLCPNCKEAIGDNLRKCPLCYYEIKETEIHKLMDEMEEKQFLQDMEAIALFRKRNIRGVILLVSYFVIMIFGMILLGVLNAPENVFIAVVLALAVAFFVVYFLSKARTCPHCDCMVPGRMPAMFLYYCPNCGGRLR